MRKAIPILGLCLIVLFLGCPKKESILSVSITQHPQGGANVSTVSCTFQGELTQGQDPISVTVEWWWEDANHANGAIQKTETFTFSSESPTSYTTSYSAGAGYILLNYWWVKIRWTNGDGSTGLVESGKAFCYY